MKNTNRKTTKKEFPYRQGTAKAPSEKRIRKFAGRPLKSFNVLYAYATLPIGHILGLPAIASYIFVVANKFFMLQYLQKIHIFHFPVKHVDNELDQKVPFRPDHIDCYLDFINYWIRPIAMMQKRFGIKQGSKLSIEFLRYIKRCYKEAYKMYTYSMTTTYRPKCPKSRAVTNVQRADPHYLCVPSLHIVVVCLCYSFYRMLFKRESFTQQESEQWNSELYAQAVAIGETVLYVKQHSVNCIPAALYMLTKITPELFTPQMAVNFINDLFKNSTDITDADKKEINSYIQFMFERLLLEGALEDDWRTPVIRWLDSYKPYEPQ